MGICPVDSSLTLSTAVSALIQQYQLLKEKQTHQWITKDLSQALIQMNEGTQEINDGTAESPSSLIDSCLSDEAQSMLSANLLKLIEQRKMSSDSNSDSLNQQLLSVGQEYSINL